MSLNEIVSARIHPAIGIARIGNSETEYFIGPEVPHPVPPPPGGYKDSHGRLKRQAALFRVYGYDKHGQVVAELDASNAEVAWTAHVANTKGAWYDFDVALDIPEAANTRSCRRNSSITGKDREKLIVDPGPRTVTGVNQRSQPFDTGRFFDQSVYLGELRTDAQGRLLFLGGRGVSASPFPGYTLTTFANNGGWHDDASDGPVSATVKIAGRQIPVDPAWVVVGPPNYGPDLVTVQTMYDVIYDALAGRLMPKPGKPSFQHDLLPLFQQFVDGQWVNYGFFTQFGWQAPNEFTRPDYLKKLSAPGDEFKELRLQTFYMFRDPNSNTVEPLLWPPIYGDAFGSFDNSPLDWFAVTKTLFRYLQQWVNGDFISDYDPQLPAPVPARLEDVPLSLQPATLDRAALHFCMGGPFHPGCEMTWPMRHTSMYRAPFRLRQRAAGLGQPDYGEYLTPVLVMSSDGPLSCSGPGDITKWMAVPWQADTASCRSGYPTKTYPDPYTPTFWPSRVPNQVLSEPDYKVVVNENEPLEKRIEAFNSRVNWLRSLHLNAPSMEQITRMIYTFGDLGVVEKRPGAAGNPNFPPVMYVESQVTAGPSVRAAALAEPAAKDAHGAAPVSEEFSTARFGGRARRS